MTVKLAFVGDIALRGKPLSDGDIELPPDLQRKLLEADIVFGNLETPFSDGEEPMAGESLTTDSVLNLGIDVLNLANNHILDCGEKDAAETVKELHEKDVGVVGAGLPGEKTLFRKNLGGYKICFLGYTQSDGRLDWFSLDGISEMLNSRLYGPLKTGFHGSGEETESLNINRMENRIVKDVEREKEKCDLLVVSLHWGEQFSHLPSPGQRQLATEISDAGADIVVGHHPHVVQPMERRNSSIIAYSLGDFIFNHPLSGHLSNPIGCLQVEFDEEGVEDHSLEIYDSNSTGIPKEKVQETPIYLEKTDYSYSEWVGRISYRYLKNNVKLVHKLITRDWLPPFVALYLFQPFNLRAFLGLFSGRWLPFMDKLQREKEDQDTNRYRSEASELYT